MSWQTSGDHPGPNSECESHQDVIRVLIAEDRASSREQICDLFSQHDDVVVVAEAQDGVQAIGCAREFTPDVVVLSMRIPGVDSIDVVQQIRRAHAGARIIMFGYPQDRPRVVEALRAGAIGYIPTVDPTTLVVDVQRAARGEAILDTDVLLDVMAELRREASGVAYQVG